MQMQGPTHPQASIENRRKKSTSGDSFSFPSTPTLDSDFEFGSLTPDSPSSDPCRTSPADHLFFNGRLQPHSFPLFHQQQNHHQPPIATTSRTSSISSKDSLVSSRSNSTNSRGSSSCSSARTSSSDSSERRRLFHSKVSSLSSSCKGGYMVKRSMVSAHHQAYGCSQRWQYITPVPALTGDSSKGRKGEMQKKREDEGTKKRRKKKKEKTGRGLRFWFGRRIFRWFVMACKECHAMEPSKGCNKEITLQENVNK